MKAIVFLAILGLGFAGLRVNVKDAKKVVPIIQDGLKIVGDLTSGNSNSEELMDWSDVENMEQNGQNAITPTGLSPAVINGLYGFVDVAGLIQDGVKTVGDATQKKKNAGTLIQDGLKIVGDLTSGNSNTEELMDWSDVENMEQNGQNAITPTGLSPAVINGLYGFVDVAGLIQDGVKTVGDATQKKKNVGTLIQDGLKVVGDLVSNSNTEELMDWSDVENMEQNGQNAITPTGLSPAVINGLYGFVDVAGLIQDGVKTVGDATQKKKNVGTLIQDGLKIVGDLTSGNSNSEELLDWSDVENMEQNGQNAITPTGLSPAVINGLYGF